MYKIVLTRQAKKDARKLEETGLKPKTTGLIKIIRHNPYKNPPFYEEGIFPKTP